MRNMYYGDSNTLDLRKIIEDAKRISKGDYRNPPEEVTIHHHKLGQSCTDRKHQQFPEPEKEGSERG